MANCDLSPALADSDRELLAGTLENLSRSIAVHGAPEQLLHGEPHPGNVLATKNGALFIDLETCCRGPAEFDLAHVPEEVSELYPGSTENCWRTAGSWFLRWSQRGARTQPTNSRTGDVQRRELLSALRGAAVAASRPVVVAHLDPSH